jgi:hypothetical protein
MVRGPYAHMGQHERLYDDRTYVDLDRLTVIQLSSHRGT